jgi:hypothetical protein
MIRKLKTGMWRIYSYNVDTATHHRRNLGTYPTKEGAVKREKQLEYFKHLREGWTGKKADAPV